MAGTQSDSSCRRNEANRGSWASNIVLPDGIPDAIGGVIEQR